MGVALEFRETMTGTFHRLEAPADERPISITVRAEIHDVRKFLIDPTAEITGEIDAQSFADHRALRGTLEINPILRRKLVYDFRFPDNEGRECRFHGEKDVELLRPLETMTTLPGSIYRGEDEVARFIMRFDVKSDLFRMLKSFRAR